MSTSRKQFQQPPIRKITSNAAGKLASKGSIVTRKTIKTVEEAVKACQQKKRVLMAKRTNQRGIYTKLLEEVTTQLEEAQAHITFVNEVLLVKDFSPDVEASIKHAAENLMFGVNHHREICRWLVDDNTVDPFGDFSTENEANE